MRRTRSHEIAAGVLMLFGVVALAGWANRPATPPSPPASASVVPSVALSCKPAPPVRVTLRPSGSGTWAVQIEAVIPVTDAVLRLGATETATPEIFWRGSLAAGEVREIEVRWSPPAGAREVWAEVANDEGGEGHQRARAALLLPAGRQAAELAAGDAATAESRTVVDPQTGQTIFEVRGLQGGGR